MKLLKTTKIRFLFLLIIILSVVLAFLYAEDEIEGGELYFEYCATCHGDNMEGGNAKSLMDGVWQFGSGDEDIISNIKDGIPKRGMPDFGPFKKE